MATLGPILVSSLAGPWLQELQPLPGFEVLSLFALFSAGLPQPLPPGLEKPTSCETAKPYFPGLQTPHAYLEA